MKYIKNNITRNIIFFILIIFIFLNLWFFVSIINEYHIFLKKKSKSIICLFLFFLFNHLLTLNPKKSFLKYYGWFYNIILLLLLINPIYNKFVLSIDSFINIVNDFVKLELEKNEKKNILDDLIKRILNQLQLKLFNEKILQNDHLKEEFLLKIKENINFINDNNDNNIRKKNIRNIVIEIKKEENLFKMLITLFEFYKNILIENSIQNKSIYDNIDENDFKDIIEKNPKIIDYDLIFNELTTDNDYYKKIKNHLIDQICNKLKKDNELYEHENYKDIKDNYIGIINSFKEYTIKILIFNILLYITLKCYTYSYGDNQIFFKNLISFSSLIFGVFVVFLSYKNKCYFKEIFKNKKENLINQYLPDYEKATNEINKCHNYETYKDVSNLSDSDKANINFFEDNIKELKKSYSKKFKIINKNIFLNSLMIISLYYKSFFEEENKLEMTKEEITLKKNFITVLEDKFIDMRAIVYFNEIFMIKNIIDIINNNKNSMNKTVNEYFELNISQFIEKLNISNNEEQFNRTCSENKEALNWF